MRELRPHQQRMLAYCQRVRHPKLFVDMRLGKTLVTVRALVMREATNVVIVGPYSVMGAWRKELDAEGIEWVEIFGSMTSRKKILLMQELQGKFLQKKSCWVLTNKEIWRSLPEIRTIPWDHRVIDESTFLKNPVAGVTKYFNSWQPKFSDWRLTGTPNPESDLDFFGQTIDLWEQKNYYQWRNHWFVQLGFSWLIKQYLTKDFHKILNDNCFFLSRKDTGTDVERIYETRIVKLPPSVRKIYNKLAEEFIMELPDGSSWETEFAPVQYSWLRRLCGGAMPGREDGMAEYWDGKLKALLELLGGELKGQQVVIWAHFREEIERIAKCLETPYIHGDVKPSERDRLVSDFQVGRFKWIVGQPACLAHSTDFSCADTMIYFSSPESLEIRKQSEKRIEAVSKSTPSLIIDLVSEGTVDEVIVRSLEKKESRAQMTREIIKSLKGSIHG